MDTDNVLWTALKLILSTGIRYAIVGFSSWLVSHHIATDGEASALQQPAVITAASVALLTALYGVYLRLKSRYSTNVALALPAGATLQDVKDVTREASVADIITTKP